MTTEASQRITEYFSDYPFLTKLFYNNYFISRTMMEAAYKGMNSKEMIQEVMEKQSECVDKIIKMQMQRANPIFTIQP